MKSINTLTYVFAFTFALIGSSTDLFAQTQGASSVANTQDKFQELLNAIDIVPTQEVLADFPNAVLRLEHIGCDLKTNAYARNRAISLLSMFENQGRTALIRLSSCAIPETRERAIYTAARTFPKNKIVIEMVLSFDHLNAKTKALWSVRALRWIAPEFSTPKLLEIVKSDAVNTNNTNGLNAIKLARRILKK